MTEHNRNCELLIDYLNGQLDEKDAVEFEKHLDECADCVEMLAEFDSLSSDIAFASEPVAPPSGMKQRILANVLDEDADSRVAGKRADIEPVIMESEPEVHFGGKEVSREPGKRNFLLPAVAALLFLSLAGNAYLYNKAETNEELAGAVKTLESLALEPVEGKASGTASIVSAGGKTNLVVQASSLKPLTGDEVYQVWLIKDEKPVPAGSFVSSTSGAGAVVFEMDGGSDWDTVAVSLEPNANNEAPKGTVILAAQIP